MTVPSLRRAGITLIGATVLARGFGYVREVVVAQAFGVTLEVDLFLAALTVPAILIGTAYYAIPNAFVPLWASGPTGHRRALSAAAIVVLGSFCIALGIAVFASPIVRLIAAGFGPGAQARVAGLLRIGSAAVVLAVLEALIRSRLLAAKSFGLPALSYVWQGVGVVVAVLGWHEQGAAAIMWGYVIGTGGAVLWDLVLVTSMRLDLRGEGAANSQIGSDGRVWVWVSLVLVVDSLSQLYAVVDRHYGSFLQSGSIAALNYAYLISGLPSAVIGLALSTAILPFLSDAAADRDESRMVSIIDRAVRWSLLFAIPASVWMIAFRVEIVGVFFQRGAFDATARQMTSMALKMSALGIVPLALAAVWSRSFYASRNWLPIVLSTSVALAGKAVLSSQFSSILGFTGLALATSCAYAIAAASTGILQRKRLGGEVRMWSAYSVKILILVGVPTLVSWAVLSTFSVDQIYARAGVAALGVLAGMIGLTVFGRLWGITQMDELVRFVRTPLRSISR